MSPTLSFRSCEFVSFKPQTGEDIVTVDKRCQDVDRQLLDRPTRNSTFYLPDSVGVGIDDRNRKKQRLVGCPSDPLTQNIRGESIEDLDYWISEWQPLHNLPFQDNANPGNSFNQLSFFATVKKLFHCDSSSLIPISNSEQDGGTYNQTGCPQIPLPRLAAFASVFSEYRKAQSISTVILTTI